MHAFVLWCTVVHSTEKGASTLSGSSALLCIRGDGPQVALQRGGKDFVDERERAPLMPEQVLAAPERPWQPKLPAQLASTGSETQNLQVARLGTKFALGRSSVFSTCVHSTSQTRQHSSASPQSRDPRDESAGARLCKKGELPQKTDRMSRYSSVRAADSDAQIGSALSARYASTCRTDNAVTAERIHHDRHHIFRPHAGGRSWLHTLMFITHRMPELLAHTQEPPKYVHQHKAHASEKNRKKQSTCIRQKQKEGICKHSRQSHQST